MKLQRALRFLPGMIGLAWRDLKDYSTRLYVRTSWARDGLKMGPSVRLHYEHREQIQIQGICHAGHYSVILVCSSRQTSPGPLLILGDNVYIGDHVNLRAAGGVISIGKNVLIANHVSLVASNHGLELGEPIISQDWQRGDILIEEDVWIGAGAVILPGAVIRQGAVIAAGAVVRGEVESHAIYGGVPARKLKSRA
jgi:acetyltransferase-like isoleucine patch superfamily enzyme